MDPAQITETADLIIEEYPSFKLEDFQLCFKKIKLSKYINLYEGLDGGKILKCIQMYSVEREEEIINFRINESNNHKKNDLSQCSDDYMRLLKKTIETKKEPAKEKPIPEQKINKGPFLKFEKEFDELRKQQGHEMFIEYKNAKYSFSEYLNFRFDEWFDENYNNQQNQ